MSMSQEINQFNIIDITVYYVLLPPLPPHRVPCVIVNFGVPLRQEEISLAEIPNYIYLLQLQADATPGNAVIAEQFTDQRTVITVGVAPTFPVTNAIIQE